MPVKRWMVGLLLWLLAGCAPAELPEREAPAGSGTTEAVDSGSKVDINAWPRRTERVREYDALHYRIQLRFDEESKSFWGETTITLSPLRDDFATCVLDAETYTVTSVSDEEGESLPFEQPEHRLVVHLAKAYQAGEKLSFTVLYEGRQVDVDGESFGMPSTYDLGLDFKEEAPDHPRLINTLSFPEGARHWFPCYDHPNDRATGEVIATVRSAYRVLSNGKLVEVREDRAANTKTFHWSQEQPHPTYLFVLVAGPYTVLEDSVGSLPLHYWVYEKNVADAGRSFHKTPDIIAFFNREFGVEYPWVKYDQITIPGIGGGAESTGATVLSQETIHDARADQDFPSHSLVAHEAAHHWWGNLISYQDWSQTWLSEGFATYSEYLYTKHDRGEEEGAINLLRKKNRYLAEARSKYMRPVVFDRWRYPNDNFDSHTYAKAAVILNMLRWITGDEAFRKVMTQFLTRHAFQPVTTRDLLTAFEETTAQDLDWFFDQWIFRPGHPVFELSYSWNAIQKNIRVKIAQVQDTKTGTPLYRTPVLIGIVTPEGKRSEKVWLEKQVEELEFEADEEPLMVRFDEGNFLLKEWVFEKSVEELLYQSGHDDVIGRAWAIDELDRYKDNPAVLLKWIETAEQDPSWFVRRAATERIGSLGRPEYVRFLQRKCLDRNSKVRVAALEALGDYKDQGLTEFFAARFDQDDSYLAQAEAVHAIGKSGDRSWLEFIRKASNTPSPHDVLKRAADWALAEIKKNSEGVFRM